jgi:hypothetical protein
MGLLDKVLSYVSENELLHIPAIAIYYYIYQCSLYPEEESFFDQLKKSIQSSIELFPESEKRDIFLHAINYCIGKMNAGEQKYIREAFELYKEGIETNLLIENGILSRYTFLNVTRIGLRLGEFDWTSHFIENYQGYLEKKHKDNIVDYSLAKLHFERGSYDEAMRLLVYADFNDILLQLNAKTMLIKIYFEKEEEDALESLLDSMRTYIQRKQVMGYHKSNYLNIIKFTKKILNLHPFQKEQIQKLRQEIEAISPLTEKEWLLAQLP